MTGAPKLLVVGGGGREHALVRALHDSPQHPEIFAAPGNPGMENIATRVAIAASEIASLAGWAKRERPDLVVVGPDLPVALGLADTLHEAGIPVLGPRRDAARVESSKVFAKRLLQKLDIPTAGFRVAHSANEARRIILGASYPLVLKADGLAAGKGVVIARREEEAHATVEAWMERGALGEAGKTLVIEDWLEGEEASLLALTDGERWMLFPAARDHKRVGEGETGPNTGGMGAFAPALAPTHDEGIEIGRRIVDPILRDLRESGPSFRGILYLGLMLTPAGPNVLEINARFGDPEAQVVLPLMEEDPYPLFLAAARGALPSERHGTFVQHAGAAVCVVLAARGYPAATESGQVIKGLDRAFPHGIRIDFAGVDRRGSRWVTNGGRILGVTARAETLERARDAAYEAVSRIHFDGMHYRKDIAATALKSGSLTP